MPGDGALDDDLLHEVDESDAFGGGAVLEVVATVDPDDRVDRAVGAVGQLGLELRVVGGQTGQRGQVPAGRTTRHGDEVTIATEFVHVGPRPGDGGLDIGDVPWPAVVRRDPVVDRQAYPALFGQPRHQRGALHLATAVHPGTARHEDHHRRRFGGQVRATPHVQGLDRVVAVVDIAAVQVLLLAQSFPEWRCAFRRGPLHIQFGGRDHAAQRCDGHLGGAFAVPAAHLAVAGGEPALGRRGHQFRCEPHAPDAHRGDGAERFETLAHHRQRRSGFTHCQQVIRGTGAKQPLDAGIGLSSRRHGGERTPTRG